MKNKTIAWIVYILVLIVTGFLASVINMSDWWGVPFSLGVLAQTMFLIIRDKDES